MQRKMKNIYITMKLVLFFTVSPYYLHFLVPKQLEGTLDSSRKTLLLSFIK